MHPADIKAALKKRGTNQAELARELGVSKTTLCYVIDGKSTSRRVAEAVAGRIGLPLKALWPGRYPEVA